MTGSAHQGLIGVLALMAFVSIGGLVATAAFAHVMDVEEKTEETPGLAVIRMTLLMTIGARRRARGPELEHGRRILASVKP